MTSIWNTFTASTASQEKTKIFLYRDSQGSRELLAGDHNGIQTSWIPIILIDTHTYTSFVGVKFKEHIVLCHWRSTCCFVYLGSWNMAFSHYFAFAGSATNSGIIWDCSLRRDTRPLFSTQWHECAGTMRLRFVGKFRSRDIGRTPLACGLGRPSRMRPWRLKSSLINLNSTSPCRSTALSEPPVGLNETLL